MLGRKRLGTDAEGARAADEKIEFPGFRGGKQLGTGELNRLEAVLRQAPLEVLHGGRIGVDVKARGEGVDEADAHNRPPVGISHIRRAVDAGLLSGADRRKEGHASSQNEATGKTSEAREQTSVRSGCGQGAGTDHLTSQGVFAGLADIMNQMKSERLRWTSLMSQSLRFGS